MSLDQSLDEIRVWFNYQESKSCKICRGEHSTPQIRAWVWHVQCAAEVSGPWGTEADRWALGETHSDWDPDPVLLFNYASLSVLLS